MTFHHRTLASFVLTFSILLLLTGCSDEPNAVGKYQGGPPPRIDSLTITAQTSSTYRAPLTGNGPTLLLGKYGDIESRVLIQFGPLPSSFPDTQIVGASLKLRTSYWFRDSSGTLGLTAHRLNDTLYWDETKLIFTETVGMFDPAEVRGTFDRMVSSRDTIISMEIDTALIRQWFRKRIDFPSGIILKPTNSSDIMWGFSSLHSATPDLRPQLLIRFRQADTIATRVIEAVQDVYVANAGIVTSSTEHMILQGGLADRGLIRFDMSAIPQNASITDATLEFERDLTRSVRNRFTVDSVLVQFLIDGKNPPTGGNPIMVAKGSGENDTLFQADMKPIVQQWAIGIANNGIALRAMGELTTLDRLVVYGASSSRPPRLRVVYSTIR